MKNSWNHLHPLSKWSFFTCSDSVQQLVGNNFLRKIAELSYITWKKIIPEKRSCRRCVVLYKHGTHYGPSSGLAEECDKTRTQILIYYHPFTLITKIYVMFINRGTITRLDTDLFSLSSSLNSLEIPSFPCNSISSVKYPVFRDT